MTQFSDWCINEFRQVGKDYGSPQEVAAYDSSHAKFRDTRRESDEILTLLGVSSGERLLDIGCGTGVLVIEAAKRGLEVVGMDISDAMLAYAKDKAAGANIDKVQFIKGAFMHFPAGLGAFDYISTSFCLHHLPDFWKYHALLNMKKFLNPGGKLFIQDAVIDEQACIANINDFIDEQEKLGGDFLRDDAIEHFRDEFSTYTWILSEMLARAGFSVLHHESFRGLICRYVCEQTDQRSFL